MRTGRLNSANLAVFSSPMLVYQAIETPWRLYMPVFLTTGVGLSLTATAGLMLWIRMFDTVIEPLLGIASDNHASRFGRRRPWMAFSVPLIVTGAVLVFYLQGGASFGWVLFAAIVLHLGHVMLVTPHGGWAFELAVSAPDATRIMGAKMWAYALGVPLTLAIPAVVEGMFHGGVPEQVGAMGALVIVTAPLTVAAVLAKIPEAKAPAAPVVSPYAWRSLGTLLLRRDLT
jgi:Na+/melibiose symporter-like transporter